MQLDGFAIIHDKIEFQSSPNLLAGCIVGIRVGRSILGLVSILTQSPGWVQLSVDGFDSFSKTEFQSSSSFNPHPTDRLGAMSPSFQLLLVDVSILTQPLGWAQCGFNPRSTSGLVVAS